MFRTIGISILLGTSTFVGAFFLTAPASRTSVSQNVVEVPRTESRRIVTESSALSAFQNAVWEMGTESSGPQDHVFNLFTVSSRPSPVHFSIIRTNIRSPKIRLPENVLTIGPLGSLAKFMDAVSSGANPTGIGLAQSIYDAAVESLGLSRCTIDDLAHGCANTVSNILRGAGVRVVASDGVEILNGNIGSSGLFDVVPGGLADAQPGDIIVSYGDDGNHIGISLDNGAAHIGSNSSFADPGIFLDNYSRESWEGEFGGSRTVVWRAKDGSTAATRPLPEGVTLRGSQNFGGSSFDSSGPTGGFSYCGDDRWSSDPKCCYKHTGPAGGSNQYDGVTTCNGGMKKVGDAVQTLPDCGPNNSKGCDAELTPKNYSCLWRACDKGKNAIWDPWTKRCGCDDGGSNILNTPDTVCPPGTHPEVVTSPTTSSVGATPVTNSTPPTPIGSPIPNIEITRYWPVRNLAPGDTKTTEGGWETSRPVPEGRRFVPGPNGERNVPCTLVMYHNGQCDFVSLAVNPFDPSLYGNWFSISQISGIDENGNVFTEYNVPGYGQDRGSAFEGRSDKFDVATDESTGDRNARGIEERYRQNGISDGNTQISPTSQPTTGHNGSTTQPGTGGEIICVPDSNQSGFAGGNGGALGSDAGFGAGAGNEAEVRSRLAAAGIDINNEPCAPGQTRGCTNVAGLGNNAVDALSDLRQRSGQDIMVTGGTEDGHQTHAEGLGVADFSRNNGALNRYIENNAVETYEHPRGLGTVYVLNQNGRNVYYMDEIARNGNPGHWHMDADRRIQ